MKVVLMEIVRSVNRSWIYDTYFSLYRAFIRGKSPGGNVRIPFWIYLSISPSIAYLSSLVQKLTFYIALHRAFMHYSVIPSVCMPAPANSQGPLSYYILLKGPPW